MRKKNWYELNDPMQAATPALLVYPERVKNNMATALAMVGGDVHRLQPHIKTCKAAEPIELMMAAGIYKFKCATIAEAALLASCGAKQILLAYQAVGPTLQRYIELQKAFPEIDFACLTDNLISAAEQEAAFVAAGIKGNIYIDINNGMNRTGIAPGLAALELYRYCAASTATNMRGLHVYDGHMRHTDYETKKQQADLAFKPVEELAAAITAAGIAAPEIICGGSPSFSVHANRPGVVCSPGTFIYWDHGYATICTEQNFLPAIVLLTRVISKPAKGLVTLDAGHKAVAAENEMARRVAFLNTTELVPLSQSEEHMVCKNEGDKVYNVGECVFALPYHVCPTVNLYDRVFTVEQGEITGYWKTVARDRHFDLK